MRDKITVLFLAADPFRQGARLELGEAMRAVERDVQRGRAAGTLKFVAHFAIQASEVQDALRRHQPRIVHFSRHGGARGGIYLGDEHGRPQLVGKEALRGLLGVVDSVRVVVVDGTGTLATIEALREVVDYTIGTNQRPGDGPAIAFARAFYGALGAGRTVLAAFELGLRQQMVDGSPEDGMPVRRIRPGVDLDATLVPKPGAGEGRRPHPPGAGLPRPVFRQPSAGT